MFNASEVALMNAFAGHAALALLDARNQQTQHRIEILEDRERVAHAMHDHAINRVSTASLVAHSLLQSSENDQTAERLWEIVDELDEAIKAIRDAVFPR